ncbi:FadR/GntR family transcriptional regulator [Actinomycetes bacterium M1A6_2h]
MTSAEPGPARQLHRSVLDALGADIASGAMPTGTNLNADDLAERYGVSRTVVREVVRVLESVGLIGVRRRVGITVLPTTEWNAIDPDVIRWRLTGPERFDQLDALGEIRLGIEPLAARLAAGRATPEQCGALTAAVIGMSSTARAADADAYLEHDCNFHRTLLDASANVMLISMSALVVASLVGRTSYDLMPSVADPDAIRLHGVVASAVQTGDPDAAETAMRAIVVESVDAIGSQREHGAGRPPVHPPRR